MTTDKKKISENISNNLGISMAQSHKFLDSFLDVLKTQSKLNIIKISRFGSFVIKSTPMRYGRNPMSKKQYVINKRNKLNFKPAQRVREILN